MNLIGIMQGRLSPPPPDRLQQFPWDTWELEFDRARKLGLDCIEWVFEIENYQSNPLWTKVGRERIRQRIAQTGVQVLSICADYFMVAGLAGEEAAEREASLAVLKQLIECVAALGVHCILLPFLERVSVQPLKLRAQAMETLGRCLRLAARRGVELCLETDLPGTEYADLLREFDRPCVRAYYDTGNAAALGYDLAADAHLLAPWLAAVHIKDRLLNGGSVPLGQGDADFPKFFRTLAEIGYTGPFILQTAFGADFEHFARVHLEFVRNAWTAAQLEAT